MQNAAKAMVAKGAHVIISSPTPNNVCETSCGYSASRFTGYCKIVVSNTGSLSAFVDHGQVCPPSKMISLIKKLTW